jgi:hypothetical protein
MVPLLIIKAYRLIPAGVRRVAFRSNGASTRALADIAAGVSPWTALRRNGRLSLRDRSGWGGPQ